MVLRPPRSVGRQGDANHLKELTSDAGGRGAQQEALAILLKLDFLQPVEIQPPPNPGYADGLDLERAKVGIGLSCRLCNRSDCRSRAFPPLEHRLALDPLTPSATPYRFEPRGG